VENFRLNYYTQPEYGADVMDFGEKGSSVLTGHPWRAISAG
jgi:hypothetical protein